MERFRKFGFAFHLNAMLVILAGCSSSSVPPADPVVLTGEDIRVLREFDGVSRFIIFLHGKIVEDGGTNAVHPDHGEYEYSDTLHYLASSGLQVISEVRESGTDPFDYAQEVTGWINHLLDIGVPPQNIAVVGFSKGAGIAVFVSDMVGNPKINYVIIAICAQEILADEDIHLAGRVLSLFETSDELGGSCQVLAQRSPKVSDFKEISFSTGEGHGAFYQADSFWLDLVIEWTILDQ